MRVLIVLLLLSCGKPLLPDKIKIDAPENIEVHHKIEIEWQFINEYCSLASSTNEELEECLVRLTSLLMGGVN